MARDAATILNGVFTSTRQHPVVNPMQGNQYGYATLPQEFVATTHHINRGNGIAILLDAPAGFAALPDPDKQCGILKALIETAPMKMDGFNAGLTVQTAETTYGRTTEKIEDPTRVERARSTPKASYVERYGLAISASIEYWTRYLIADPETQTALYSTLSTPLPTDNLNDIYSFNWIFIIPDVSRRFVLHSWLVLGSFFKGNGDITGSKDAESSGETLTLDLELTGVCLYRVANDTLAQAILDSMPLTAADPMQRANFITGVAPAVAAKNGYAGDLANLGNSSLATA